MEVYKAFLGDDKPKWKSLIPILSAISGGLLGLGWYFLAPDLTLLPNFGIAVVMGIISGLGATGGDQLFKQFYKKPQLDSKPDGAV